MSSLKTPSLKNLSIPAVAGGDGVSQLVWLVLSLTPCSEVEVISLQRGPHAGVMVDQTHRS